MHIQCIMYYHVSEEYCMIVHAFYRAVAPFMSLKKVMQVICFINEMKLAVKAVKLGGLSYYM